MNNFHRILSSKLCLLFFQIVTQSYLAWSLGPSGRGEYAIALVYAVLLAALFVIGSDYAGTYFLASKQLNLSESVVYTFLLVASGSIVAYIAGSYLTQLPIAIFDKAALNIFSVATLSIPFFLYTDTLLRILTGVSEYGLYSTMLISRAVMFLIVIFLFNNVLKYGVTGIFYAKILCDVIIISLILFLLNRKHGLHRVYIDHVKIKKIVSYGTRNYIGKLSRNLNARLGVLVLAFFVTKEEIGFFSIALLIASKIVIIPDSLSLLLVPKIAETGIQAKSLVASSVRLIGIFTGLILLVLCMSAKPIVSILFGTDFMPVAALLQLVLIGYWFNCMGKGFATYLIGTNHPGLNSVSSSLGLFVYLISMIFLLPLIGIHGASISTSITFCVNFLLLLLFFVKISELKIMDIFTIQRKDFDILLQIKSKLREP